MARDLVGISLDERKTDFLLGRLNRRLAFNGLNSYSEYIELVKKDAAEKLAFAEALTTHTTSFFREKLQYDWLMNEGLPELCRGTKKSDDLTVWSAACSTGQEGYSALFVLHQFFDNTPHCSNFRVIGTDISRPVIRRAATAVYSGREVADIPTELRRKFLMESVKSPDVFRIVPELRKQTKWKKANLATTEGLDGISADIVFLRNVLIYFDPGTRETIIDNIYRRLRPGGFFFTGHTEASQVRREGLEVIRPSIFRKVS